MESKRKSGILLHISSLPSAHGVGDLGVEAYNFVDQLAENGFAIWQILPLNPVGPGNSPYQAYSAFAGESIYISLEKVKDWGLLNENDFNDVPIFKENKVDFTLVRTFKEPLLKKAWSNFENSNDDNFKSEFSHFKSEHSWWIDDYVLYAVCKTDSDGKTWNKWEDGLFHRTSAALDRYTALFVKELEFEKFKQFLFFRQWFRLKEYANLKGVQFFGDLPLYVSHDSSDVWGNQRIFMLDESGEPNKIGGVPPDYFSEDGQLWGNPVFDWNKLAENDYHWWISRLYFNFHMFNMVRIDHFRGLESFWAIPKDSPTAKNGEWIKAKGREMLQILKSRMDQLPVIAEDLGLITQEVEQLRDDFDLPGMKVLQFAYTSDYTNVHMPHNFNGRNVVYTGTHDNNTLLGWLASISKDEKAMVDQYVKETGVKAAMELTEMAWSSTAELAILPMQDVLRLGGIARMNVPGVAKGNWSWRYKKSQLKKLYLEYLKELNIKYNRFNG